jgi:hypothetical protein
MKKILIFSLLLFSASMFSQETFVKKYTSFITKDKGILTPWEKIDVTVVFNPNHVRDVVFYYISGKTMTFHQTSSVKEGKTSSGDGYQAFDCIDQDGIYVRLQLFDDNTCLRILISEGYMVEFHND